MTNDVENTLPQPENPLITFPSVFPIKVMGEADATFAATISSLIQKIVPQFDERNIESRVSSAGKYTSLTCFVLVESQAQLDDIYRAVSAHPMVKFSL